MRASGSTSRRTPAVVRASVDEVGRRRHPEQADVRLVPHLPAAHPAVRCASPACATMSSQSAGSAAGQRAPTPGCRRGHPGGRARRRPARHRRTATPTHLDPVGAERVHPVLERRPSRATRDRSDRAARESRVRSTTSNVMRTQRMPSRRISRGDLVGLRPFADRQRQDVVPDGRGYPREPSSTGGTIAAVDSALAMSRFLPASNVAFDREVARRDRPRMANVPRHAATRGEDRRPSSMLPAVAP